MRLIEFFFIDCETVEFDIDFTSKVIILNVIYRLFIDFCSCNERHDGTYPGATSGTETY